MTEDTPAPQHQNEELNDQFIADAAHRVVGETTPGTPLPLKDSYVMREAFNQNDWEETVTHDMHAVKVERDQAIHDADHDPMTGFLNRRGFHKAIEERLQGAKSGEVGLVFIDLDDFKILNDRMGHDQGDAFLEKFGDWLSNHVRHDNGRQGDILSSLVQAGRIGGDEFALIVDLSPTEDTNNPDMSPIERLDILMGRINAGFEEFLNKHPSYKRTGVGASLGAAIWDQDMTAADLIKIADQEMYFVKQNKNKVPRA